MTTYEITKSSGKRKLAHRGKLINSGGLLAPSAICYAAKVSWNGEVSERFKEHAWKACVGETQPWVRIPPSPPYKKPIFKAYFWRYQTFVSIREATVLATCGRTLPSISCMTCCLVKAEQQHITAAHAQGRTPASGGPVVLDRFVALLGTAGRQKQPIGAGSSFNSPRSW
jgi:hypothetical protein